MAPPEANIETVVLARNLPNDCIDFSIPGGSARDETALAILLSKYQRAKIVEVHRQSGYYTKLKMDKLAANARNTASSEAVPLLHFQIQWKPRRRLR
jgi:hypothetical protein